METVLLIRLMAHTEVNTTVTQLHRLELSASLHTANYYISLSLVIRARTLSRAVSGVFCVVQPNSTQQIVPSTIGTLTSHITQLSNLTHFRNILIVSTCVIANVY